jgi:4-oxalocrotonate tautomerase
MARPMLLVRIELNENSSTKLKKTIGEVVYSAMTEVANVLQTTTFRYLRCTSPTSWFIRTKDIWASATLKTSSLSFGFRAAQRIRRRLSSEQFVMILYARAGVRKEDVWISLIDADRTDWSFGKSEMQYEPKIACIEPRRFPLRQLAASVTIKSAAPFALATSKASKAIPDEKRSQS